MQTSFRALCCLLLIFETSSAIAQQNANSPSQGAQNFKPKISVATSSCLSVPTGSPQVGIFKNNCDKPLQFTIHWSGSQPPREKTYRIGPNENRELKMLDSNGSVTTEGPPTFGIGPKGDVSVVQKHTSIQNTDVLAIQNHHSTYGLVKVILRLYFPSGQNSPSTHLLVMRPGSLGDVNITFFLTDVFARWDVQSLQAEDDPQ